MSLRLSREPNKTKGLVDEIVAAAPGVKSKALEKMRQNPKGDWKIPDLEKVCSDIGLTISPPSNGSHYKVSSGRLDGILSIPARRPIKAFYIKSFVSLCDKHVYLVAQEENHG